ncbi:hemolysin-activating ACP:hemolysin acyltransferase [Rubricella aquisinus]|uniref:RTX toxin-activating lysine-acyltransferase n=1 Tax=Rubricella aquisinus TaxID=2028108 RepID=A0A840WQV2_9RHOB|nr:hemolysin-activating ACP:hemolysin acyltransferase [Rubricella aquisinus]
MPGAPSHPTAADKIHVAGGVLYLCSHAEIQRDYTVGQLIEQVLPAIETGQFRYYEREDGEPIAFVAWANTTEEGLRKLKRGASLVGPEDWTGGDRLVFVELIAPFGHVRDVRDDLAENVFPDGTSGISLRPVYDRTGTLAAVRTLTFRFTKKTKNTKGEMAHSQGDI